MEKFKCTYQDDNENTITYTYLDKKVFKFLKPKRIDLSTYFQEILFEMMNDKKEFKLLNEQIDETVYFSIEINNNQLYIIELNKYNFNFYVENGNDNIDNAKLLISTFYGYLIGYIRGFKIGYNSIGNANKA